MEEDEFIIINEHIKISIATAEFCRWARPEGICRTIGLKFEPTKNAIHHIMMAFLRCR